MANDTDPIRPDFLHIGSGKCKSTWLYHVCLAHPEIFVPGQGYDNVNFFVNTYQRGLDWYAQTFFSGYEGQSVVGEFSNSYMVFEPALQRIRKHLPDVKLTMTLMNPVHKIFYGWAHANLKDKCGFTLFGERRDVSRIDVQSLLEKCGMDPARSLVVPLDRVFHHHGHSHFRSMVEGSMYGLVLERVYRYFAPEQVKVMLYEDLLKDRERFLRDFYRFLEVDEDFACDILPESVNPDPPLLENERWFPAELRMELIESLRDDIERFQEMIGRDLSHWLDDETTYRADYCRNWR